MGIIYLMTSELYERESYYKIGISQNIYERNKIQLNSSPIKLYYKIIVFSSEYKDFEKELKKEINNLNIEKCNGEWIKCEFDVILNIFYKVAMNIQNFGVCVNGNRYVYENNNFIKKKLPNCNLKMLGIKDGDKIVCINNNESFEVKGNKILVNGSEMHMSKYMNLYFPRQSSTNEHRGQQYFKYKTKLISELWDNLFNQKLLVGNIKLHCL